MTPLPIDGTTSTCAVCGGAIHAAAGRWFHDLPFDPFAPPVHAPRPVHLPPGVPHDPVRGPGSTFAARAGW